MNVVFRVDATLRIGSGHFFRCLTLAEGLKKKGASCHFIFRFGTDNLIKKIIHLGFHYSVLPAITVNNLTNRTDATESDYSSWLGVDWLTDACQTQIYLIEKRVDWLVVDHYGIDERWETFLRSSCNRIMVIDDLANRSHNCDLLLDQNFGRTAGDYETLVPQGCELLIGPKNALLRPEFAELRSYSLKRRAAPRLKQLLVSMGGVDLPDATGAVLEALSEFNFPDDVRIVVAMGSSAPALARVNSLAKRMPIKTRVFVDCGSMAQLMADSDLAIGAAGGSAWERCSLGLPTFLIVLAENQLSGALALSHAGAARLIESINDMKRAIPALLNASLETNLLSELSGRSSLIVDGRGVERACDSFKKFI
jgi:UDP-2,4-diacetamido-2,4,6-trideoxy-beta-L-altropyranose hydrolase